MLVKNQNFIQSQIIVWSICYLEILLNSKKKKTEDFFFQNLYLISIAIVIYRLNT